MASPTGGGESGNGRDQILEERTALLTDFIHERLQLHGDSNTEVTRAQLGEGETDPVHRQLAQRLREIHDSLDGNVELQRMINGYSKQGPARKVFLDVAAEVFSDGNVSWGRIAALSYFAGRLGYRAATGEIVNWIRDQGGWERIRSHFGSSTWQTLAVFSAGVLTTFLVTQRS
ncbi:apoptosis regulator BAX-like [Centroberyx affinis]|uniref:apoptosis regulator BAX-like n=1 Tax=Centroberyx affinis TaxID=166261 RepID=UPI003A5BF0E5